MNTLMPAPTNVLPYTEVVTASNTDTAANTDTMARVKQTVLNALNLAEREITPDTSLTDDLHADSLDLVEIAMALEEEFGITLGEDTLLLTSVGQITAYVEAQQAAVNEVVPYM